MLAISVSIPNLKIDRLKIDKNS